MQYLFCYFCEINVFWIKETLSKPAVMDFYENDWINETVKLFFLRIKHARKNVMTNRLVCSLKVKKITLRQCSRFIKKKFSPGRYTRNIDTFFWPYLSLLSFKNLNVHRDLYKEIFACQSSCMKKMHGRCSIIP